jgi:Leucine-rich repeat (LRR) protein
MGLTVLHKDTFQNASNMQEIHLSGNSIKTLEPNVFSPSKQLKRLVMSTNLLSEIDPNAFEGLNELQDIDLSNNLLVTIPHKTFGQLSNLRYLNLRNNTLQVRYGMFPESLVSLDLSYNKLENFTLKSIINLENLKQLYLNGNHIYRFRQFIFPDGILGPLKHLKYIQLSDNDFYCTTLADIVIWLDKHKIQIKVEPHFLVINNSNIRGVGCKEEQRFFV